MAFYNDSHIDDAITLVDRGIHDLEQAAGTTDDVSFSAKLTRWVGDLREYTRVLADISSNEQRRRSNVEIQGPDLSDVGREVIRLGKLVRLGSLEEMASVAIRLAQLPGDPTVGLPPPIKAYYKPTEIEQAVNLIGSGVDALEEVAKKTLGINLSARLTAWARDLKAYNRTLAQMFSVAEYGSIHLRVPPTEDRFLVRITAHNPHEVASNVWRMAKLARAGSFDEMAGVAKMLAQLPGDPTVGLPPPIKVVKVAVEAESMVRV
ncbi:MAG: hypothetical protein WB609_12840 [Candidatus Cybelea sp.]